MPSLALLSSDVLEPVLDPSRFNCLTKLLRITALVMRFIGILKSKSKGESKELTASGLSNAEIYWVKAAQNLLMKRNLKRGSTSLDSFMTVMGLGGAEDE